MLDALEAFFGQIHCAAQEAGLEALIETDLSFSQFRSLLILSQAQDPLPIHELAEKLRLSVAATGRAVERLVKEGFVERQEDELDRRIKRISLSVNRADLVAAFHQSKRTQALTFIDSLDPADRERLLGALLPIIERYPAPIPRGQPPSDCGTATPTPGATRMTSPAPKPRPVATNSTPPS